MQSRAKTEGKRRVHISQDPQTQPMEAGQMTPSMEPAARVIFVKKMDHCRHVLARMSPMDYQVLL